MASERKTIFYGVLSLRGDLQAAASRWSLGPDLEVSIRQLKMTEMTMKRYVVGAGMRHGPEKPKGSFHFLF